MQIILADAKIMREVPATAPTVPTSLPIFQNEAEAIAEEMSMMSIEDIQKAFHCSLSIANESLQRFKAFGIQPKSPALLSYHGHAYKHLQADDFTDDDLTFAQKHLTIMSFMYGLLRPLDLISHYRMTANTKLEHTGDAPIQTWWRRLTTEAIIKRVNDDDGILIDLATTEFENMCDWKRIEKEVTVIKPLFLVHDGLKYKNIAIYSKACRGAMTRFIIKNRLSSADEMKSFSDDGFSFNARLGDYNHPHYLREGLSSSSVCWQ